MVEELAWAHAQLLDEQLVDPEVVSLLEIVDVEGLRSFCHNLVAGEEEHSLLLFQHFLSKCSLGHYGEFCFEARLIRPAVIVKVIYELFQGILQ